MDWKKALLGGFTEDNPEPVPTLEDETAPVPRPAKRPAQAAALSPLAALRQGPTASMFTRTTGLSAVLSSPVSTTTHVAVDREFDAVIVEALNQDAKAPGFKEFTAQLTALAAIIPDRGQCVKAALVAMATINPSLNATVVTKAIGERLKLLSDYNAGYDADSRKSESTEQADKLSAVSEIEGRLQDIDTEIQRLAGERAQCETQKMRLDGELQGTGAKYDGYRARFSATVEARRAELKNLLNAVAPGAAEKEN